VFDGVRWPLGIGRRLTFDNGSGGLRQRAWSFDGGDGGQRWRARWTMKTSYNAAVMYNGEASAEDYWDRVEDVMGGGGSGGCGGQGLDEDDNDNGGNGSSGDERRRQQRRQRLQLQ